MKCPACGYDNIEGTDRCEDCMEPFRDLDVPQPKEGFQAHLMRDSVKKLYSSSPATVASSDSLAMAVEVMKQTRAGCVAVVDHGALNGILTEVDLLYDLRSETGDLQEITVSELMTPNPECVEEDATIASALHLMSVGGYRHLPVTRDGALIGILSIKDILRYLKQRLV